MNRRRFDHLHAELSIAAEANVPRYGLWLAVHDLGLDPEHLSADDALGFLDFRAPSWLRETGHALSDRDLRQVRKEVKGYDPSRPLPDDRFEAFA